MDEQLEFLQPVTLPPGKNSLFLALFPSPGAVPAIAEVAAGLRNRHGLRSRVRPSGHWHVTLHWFGYCSEPADSVTEALGRICGPVAAGTPPVEIVLDRATSFGGRRDGVRPLVLTGRPDGNLALKELHRRVKESGVPGEKGRAFQPHLTLFYDRHVLQDEPVPAVSWKADEIVLVLSEVGVTKYHHLCRWKLGAGLQTDAKG